MSENHVVLDAHTVWSDGFGRFGQSVRFFCVGKCEWRRS